MGIGQKWLASRYNQPGFEIFDYHIYAVCGDGCMMEGVASEAASLAGHLGLDNLCWIYDNNHITIEGNTRIAFTEDIAARFLGYGWNVLRVGDANDIDRIEHALTKWKLTMRIAAVSRRAGGSSVQMFGNPTVTRSLPVS
jgi:transketolase